MIPLYDLTDQEILVINTVKEKLYRQLSYTSQDYLSIMKELVGIFTGDASGNTVNALTTRWDNISEADIMFIFMSLLAAHKDMLNYMLDYRVLEGYMNTAKERQSLVRIANSFGYKIPSYKAARALVAVSAVEIVDSFIIPQFMSFLDSNNINWVYLGQDTTVELSDTLELFQGVLNSINISPENFDRKSMTHIINNQSIAIGNNYNSVGCSSLTVDTGGTVIEFTEVDNLYTYTGTADYVYMLDVDPQGITYIKLPKTFDIDALAGYTMVFKYLATRGAAVSSIGDIVASVEATSDALQYDITLLLQVATDFTVGADAYTPIQIKEGFKSYYASADTLVTLADYKNYILNIQKIVPTIEKCIVLDNQADTLGGIGDANIASLTVCIYALKTDNTELSAGEESLLLADLANRKVSGIIPMLNEIALSTREIEELSIYVDFNAVITDAIKVLVSDFISSKSFGELITASDINDMLIENGYNFYGNIAVGTANPPTGSTTVQLAYYQYPGCPTGNITGN